MEVFFKNLRGEIENFFLLFFSPSNSRRLLHKVHGELDLVLFHAGGRQTSLHMVTTPLKCFGNCSASFPRPQPHWPLSVVTKKEKKWFSFLSFEQVAAGCLSNLSKIGFAVEMADFSRTHRREPIDGRPEQ